jgi:PAS domain S-box-containing protein
MNANELLRQRITAGAIAVLWTVAVALSLTWNKKIRDSEVMSFARIEADSVLFKDIIIRDWITLKGNVYAPVSEHTSPNPHLIIPERDLTLPGGRQYTLINPAFMTREVHDLQNQRRHILGHITSLAPLRPRNAPDLWESQVLKQFEHDRADQSTVQEIDGTLYFRLMRPLITRQECLRCHAHQGYTVGSVRGGISASIPLAPLLESAQRHFLAVFAAHGLIWLFGIVAVLAWTWKARRHISERIRHEKELLIKETAIAHSSNAVVLTDLEGNITYANGMFYSLLGIEEGTAPRGASIFRHLNIPDATEIVEEIVAMKKWYAEVSIPTANSMDIHVLIAAALITSPSGAMVGITFSIADITMRKSAETALTETREALKQRHDTMEKDLMIAQLVQHDLMSMKTPQSDYLNIDYRYRPVEKVGGDIFSFSPGSDGALGLFIGDVTGHGVAAALFHSLIKSALEKIGMDHFNAPGTYIHELNNELAGSMTSYFLTGIYGCFRLDRHCDAVIFAFANGGHPAPVLMRRQGGLERLPAGGTVLGLTRDNHYDETVVTLRRGDRLFLYTDGIPETTDSGHRMIGYDEGLSELINRSRRESLSETLDAILEQLGSFRGAAPISDDVLIIGIEVR